MYERGSFVKKCKHCGQVKVLFTSLIFAPARMAMFLEKFDREHKHCAGFRDQKRAQAALKWQRGIEKYLTPEAAS